MIDELRPLGLYDAARTLGIDPFEVVRLLVLGEAFPDGTLVLTPDHVQKIRETGGIEHWWDQDAPEGQALVLAMIGKMVDDGLVGESGTRIDNLWRGLGDEQQALLQQAVNILAQNAQILSFMTPRGVQVSLAPDAVGLLGEVAAEEAQHDQLAVLWG